MAFDVKYPVIATIVIENHTLEQRSISLGVILPLEIIET